MKTKRHGFHGALTVVSLVIAAVLYGSGPAAAQEAPAPCSTDAFRAFDYWSGEWVVRNADGDEVGKNTISPRSGGCMLLEEWRSSDGTTGTSMNYYDPGEDMWHQHWVGGGGQILNLSGGLVDGVMTLSGPRQTPRGMIEDRIKWILLDDGRVEQLWEISPDGGETWRQVFQGFYERAPMGE